VCKKGDECGRIEIKGVKIRLTVKGVKTSVNEKYLSTSLITCLLKQVTAGERLNDISGQMNSSLLHS